MEKIRFPFGRGKFLIGVVHLKPLPGSPGFCNDLDAVLAAALADAGAYARGGMDGLIVENFGDAPFHPCRVAPHTVACIALAAREIRRRCRCPVGINVLRNDGLAALGAARAAGAGFVRVNIFTGAAVTDQGIIEGEAHELVRYRNLIGGAIAILADVHVKHSAPLHPTDIGLAAKEAYLRGRADGLIVTGRATSEAPALADIRAVRAAAPKAPLLAGSGVTPDNASEIMKHVRGAIVGTWCKAGGDIDARVDARRVSRLVQAARP